ncbi:MAG TPA: RNA polymerase Rpb6 [Flavobacteriales bacterium]|nr:RNA polymerase Rpb6 [Flavobacteriales bacterium]HIO67237.1 RNA polymerase Rpb6 [Flavobacteriales bacterium]
MDYKKTKANTTAQTVNIIDYEKNTGNIYESIVVMAKRANQISAEMKEELDSKLAEFATSNDNLEEVFENREQIEISKFYERLPKPSLIAADEFLDDKIYIRRKVDEVKEKEEGEDKE